MDALIASFPILLVVVTMLAFGLPAKVALPLGWLATLAAPLLISLGFPPLSAAIAFGVSMVYLYRNTGVNAVPLVLHHCHARPRLAGLNGGGG